MSTPTIDAGLRSTSLLSVRDLHVRFALPRGGFVQAVDGVSFELARGEALGLVGESGSGKSTCARAIIGLTRVHAGSVVLDGHELVGRSPRAWKPLRRRVQMVFQDPYASLDPRQTVLDILLEPLSIQRVGTRRTRRARVLELLSMVGLDATHAGRYAHEFSGGQRQRIAIARALALEPELLVLDEPVSALDVSVQAQIVNLLGELQARLGLGYLFIAHDLAIVRHLCTRVAVMYLGRIVEEGPRDELYERPRHPYTRALLSAVPSIEPGVGRTRIALAGDPPSPAHPPSGCVFHPRCALHAAEKDERCVSESPALRSVGDARVACHLAASQPRL